MAKVQARRLSSLTAQNFKNVAFYKLQKVCYLEPWAL